MPISSFPPKTITSTDAITEAQLLQACNRQPDRLQKWITVVRFYHEGGYFLQADQFCERSLEHFPTEVGLWLLKAQALLSLGQLKDALLACERFLQKLPEDMDGLCVQMAILTQLGEHKESLALSKRIQQLQPKHPGALSTQISAYLHLGQFSKCLRVIEQMLTLDPPHLQSHINKSACLLSQDRYKDAKAAATTGLKFYPQQSQLSANLATALLALEEPTAALRTVERCLTSVTDYGLLLNKVYALLALDRREEALLPTLALIKQQQSSEYDELFQTQLEYLLQHQSATTIQAQIKALVAHDPALLAHLLLLGARSLLAESRFKEALVFAQDAATIPAAKWLALALQAQALSCLQEFQAADELLSQIGAHDPKFLQQFFDPNYALRTADCLQPIIHARALFTEYVHLRWSECDWKGLDALNTTVTVLVEEALAHKQPLPMKPMHGITLPILTPSQCFALGQRHGYDTQQWIRQRYPNFDCKHTQHKRNHRLRIAYVSADLRDHATGHLIRNLFQSHNREKFEVYAYALHPPTRDPYHSHIAHSVEHFIDASQLNSRETAQDIYHKQIDVLIDLHGYTRGARPEIFALEPAPVQATYLAYASSTGAKFFHYMIIDPHLMHDPATNCYSETPVYLPHCYQINDHWQKIAKGRPNRKAEGLPSKGFVYCCFNGGHKIQPWLFADWMKILTSVPNSVLWLLPGSERCSKNLIKEADTHGIAPNRLCFAQHKTKPEHLKRLRLAGLFLDTYHYNAHTTASDALWAGVPVLTRPGKTLIASRVGKSLLTAVGLPELIVESRDAYINLAITLSQDGNRLSQLKQRLQMNRLRCPLFDTKASTRYLEQAYEAMWAQYEQASQHSPIWIQP